MGYSQLEYVRLLLYLLSTENKKKTLNEWVSVGDLCIGGCGMPESGATQRREVALVGGDHGRKGSLAPCHSSWAAGEQKRTRVLTQPRREGLLGPLPQSRS